MNTIHPNNPSYIDGYHYPKFDQRDADLLAARQEKWDARTGPRVGDFVIMPDGTLSRCTHDWQPWGGMQTGGEGGSYYLTNGGDASYSGGLDPAIDIDRFADTGETRDGAFWFFHHDSSGAHNGVQCTMPCRVYRVRVQDMEDIGIDDETPVGWRSVES